MWDLGSPFYVLSAVGLNAAISNNSGCMGGQLVLTTANLGIPNLNGGAIGSGYDVLRMYLESRKCAAQKKRACRALSRGLPTAASVSRSPISAAKWTLFEPFRS